MVNCLMTMDLLGKLDFRIDCTHWYRNWSRYIYLIRQSIFRFKMFQLFLKILCHHMELLQIRFLSILVTNSPNDPDSINKFNKWKTIILWRFRYFAFSWARSVLILLPEFLVFKYNLLQIFKSNNYRIYFAQLTKLEEFNSWYSYSITWEISKEFLINTCLFICKSLDLILRICSCH